MLPGPVDNAGFCVVPGRLMRLAGVDGVPAEPAPGITSGGTDAELREQLETLCSAVRELGSAVAPASIIVFAQDRDLRYRWILNPDFGALQSDILGRTDRELNPEGANVDALEAMKRRVLASAEPLRQEVEVEWRGIRRWYDLHVQPRRVDGEVVGVLCVARDVTDRKLAQAELAEREARYRALFWSIDEGYCLCEMITDAAGRPVDYRFLEVNPLFESMTGLADAVGRTARELVPSLEDHWVETYARAGLHGEQIRFQQRSDAMGRSFDVFTGPAEVPGRFVIVFRDVTERERQEERIRLLAGEATHRTKNILSIVLAIARQTTGDDVADFTSRLTERIAALAASNDLLAASQWRGVDLHELVTAQLSHFAELIASRISLDGPRLTVSPEAAETISMALHELSTNAVKYGALSNAAGTVSLGWSADSRSFAMRWQEAGGPLVTAPARKGFGSVAVERLARLRLDAEVRLDFAPTGVVWDMTCPLERVARPDDAPAAVGIGAAR